MGTRAFAGSAATGKSYFGRRVSGDDGVRLKKRNRQERNLLNRGHFIGCASEVVAERPVDGIIRILMTEYLQRRFDELFAAGDGEYVGWRNHAQM